MAVLLPVVHIIQCCAPYTDLTFCFIPCSSCSLYNSKSRSLRRLSGNLPRGLLSLSLVSGDFYYSGLVVISKKLEIKMVSLIVIIISIYFACVVVFQLILVSVLNCLYDSISHLLRKNVEKRALLENMDGIFLAIDEICDDGYEFIFYCCCCIFQLTDHDWQCSC
jgi:Clathrin adaptor complex small chain